MDDLDDVYWQVVSRGDLKLSGVKKVQFRPEEDGLNVSSSHRFLNEQDQQMDAATEATTKLVGSVDIDLEIAVGYGPTIAILAYYVRQDREVISADFQIPLENCFPNPVNPFHPLNPSILNLNKKTLLKLL